MLKEYLSTLANKFRSVLGTTEKINAQDFPDKVTEVYEKGYIKGDVDGYDKGVSAGFRECEETHVGLEQAAFNTGLEEGEENGRQAEYDRFWDNYQDYGNRTNYGYGFCAIGWNNETFKPKYTIYGGNYCFYTMNQTTPFDGSNAVDFKDIPLDCSNLKTATYMFANCNCKNITVDLSNCTSLLYTFLLSGGGFLDGINLKVSENLTTVTNAFNNTWTLKKLRFTEDSVIACNGFNFSWSSNLTQASILSILNALKDYSGTSGYSITLGTTNLAKLTDAEKAIATQKGWTLA